MTEPKFFIESVSARGLLFKDGNLYRENDEGTYVQMSHSFFKEGSAKYIALLDYSTGIYTPVKYKCSVFNHGSSIQMIKLADESGKVEVYHNTEPYKTGFSKFDFWKIPENLYIIKRCFKFIKYTDRYLAVLYKVDIDVQKPQDNVIYALVTPKKSVMLRTIKKASSPLAMGCDEFILKSPDGKDHVMLCATSVIGQEYRPVLFDEKRLKKTELNEKLLGTIRNNSVGFVIL